MCIRDRSTSSSSGLSQSTADIRYLIKTTGDTTTPLQTFNGGVQVGTNGIDTSSLTSILSIGTAQAASISIASSGSPTTVNGILNDANGLAVGGGITSYPMYVNSSLSTFGSIGVAGVYAPVANSVNRYLYIYSCCNINSNVYLDKIGVSGQTVCIFNNNLSGKTCTVNVQTGGNGAPVAPSIITTNILMSPPTVAGGSVYNYTSISTSQSVQVPLYSFLTFTYFSGVLPSNTSTATKNLWIRTG